MKPSFLIALLFIFISACNSDEKSQNTPVVKADKRAVSKTQNWNAPEFSQKAREAVNTWKNFREFESNINYVNQAGVNSIADETRRMTEISDTLLQYIPKKLKTNPIESRTRVLKTRVYLLDERLNQQGISDSLLYAYLNEMNVAYTNLILKINEKFEKEAIDEMTRTQQNLRQSNRQQNDSL